LLIDCSSIAQCSTKLVFEDQLFERKPNVPAENCLEIKVKNLVATGVPVVIASIKKCFTLKMIFYLGENPSTKKDYNGLLKSFIDSLNQKKEFPNDKLAEKLISKEV
jgi:Holliday junction resolvase RusA-like endonuclease